MLGIAVLGEGGSDVLVVAPFPVWWSVDFLRSTSKSTSASFRRGRYWERGAPVFRCVTRSCPSRLTRSHHESLQSENGMSCVSRRPVLVGDQN